MNRNIYRLLMGVSLREVIKTILDVFLVVLICLIASLTLIFFVLNGYQ